MATVSPMTKPAADVRTPGPSRLAAAATVVSNAAATAAGAANDAATRLPDLADHGWAAFEDANRRIQAASDQTLAVGTALSFGFAVGLLLGGASRILVALGFVPVVMMGSAMLDRAARGADPASRQA